MTSPTCCQQDISYSTVTTMSVKLLSDLSWQEKPLTGFLSRVGLASGVREGIQKLGRLWLEVAAEPAVEETVELFSVGPFSLPLTCPDGGKTLDAEKANISMQQKDEAVKVGAELPSTRGSSGARLCSWSVMKSLRNLFEMCREYLQAFR